MTKMKCKVISLGTMGANVNSLLFNKANTLMICTRATHLNLSQASEKILSGRKTCLGVGCKGDTILGYLSAKETFPELGKNFDNELNIFVFALGGGTGTGHAKYILSSINKTNLSNNELNIAFCVMPFKFESKRLIKAKECISHIIAKLDLFIIIEQGKINTKFENNSSIRDFFREINISIAEWIEKISVTKKRDLIKFIRSYDTNVVRINNKKKLIQFNKEISTI